MINVSVSRNIQEKMWEKKVKFGILLHVVVKMVDIQEALLRIHQYSDKKHSKNLNKKM